MIHPGDSYAPAPRPGRAHAILAAALSAAFVAATVVLAVLAHHGGLRSATPGGVAPSGPPSQVQINGGATGEATACCASPSVPTPTLSSPPPLDPEAINRTFQVYMNALLHHDLRALKSATCPRLRHTEVGFALHGKYVRAWRGKPYTIEPGLDFVTVRALVRLTDPTTGGGAGKAVYSWYVRGTHIGRYYVCGFLS